MLGDMKIPYQKLLIALLVIVVLGLLARYVVFKDRFDEFGAGLERIGAWEDDYRRDHPGATDEEVDAAFREGITNIELWQARYRSEHPDATDAEVDAAFRAQFETR